jgi:hypothetical protein
MQKLLFEMEDLVQPQNKAEIRPAQGPPLGLAEVGLCNPWINASFRLIYPLDANIKGSLTMLLKCYP